MPTKTYKCDFFVITVDDDIHSPTVFELLRDATDHTPAFALEGGDEKHQIRSIVRLPGGGQAFKAVFGRIRKGEKPEQANEDGEEADVDLLPGHGLVEKNYFMFHGRRNLLVYQRNSTASHYGRLQRYLRLATGTNLQLSPILTTDAYDRVLNGGDARVVELSIQQPRDPSFYRETLTGDAIGLLRKMGGFSASMRFSVGRSKAKLIHQAKEAAVIAARHGFGRVARVTLDEGHEVIDLIADRVVEPITVALQANGRPRPEDVYAGISEAIDKRRDDLATFFGP